MKYGNINFLETAGLLQVYNGTALLLTIVSVHNLPQVTILIALHL
jgi:hypothetical protein